MFLGILFKTSSMSLDSFSFQSFDSHYTFVFYMNPSH